MTCKIVEKRVGGGRGWLREYVYLHCETHNTWPSKRQVKETGGCVTGKGHYQPGYHP